MREDAWLSGVECMTIHACALRNPECSTEPQPGHGGAASGKAFVRVVVSQAQTDFEKRSLQDARLSGVECRTIHACALRNLRTRNVQVH